MNRLRHRLRRSGRGQGLVEFALIVPLLMLLLLLGLDFGRVFFGWVGLTNASRIGASYAAAHPTAWGSPGSATERASYNAQILADAAALNCTLPGTLPAPTFAAGTDLGDTARVTLTCTFTLITPIVSELLGNSITIEAESVFPIRAGLAGTTPVSTPVPTPSPSPSPSPTPDPSAPCCYTNPSWAGVCEVRPTGDETCASILDYLNHPRSVGKTYCNNTDIRGGWEPVVCE